jgi:hypothetical protein
MTKTLRERLSKLSIEEIVAKAVADDILNRELNRSEFGGLPFFNRKKAIDSLDYIGNNTLANKIRNCRIGSKCQSFYCLDCRPSIVSAQLHRFYRHLELIPNPSNDQFRQISGVLGLARFNSDDARKLIEADKNNFDSFRRQIKKIEDYRFIEIAYEIELIDRRKLLRSKDSPRKKEQVRQLLESSSIADYENLLLYVHFHGITNLTREEIPKTFKNRYFVNGEPVYNHSSATGLYIQEFHSTQSLDKNLAKLASYPFKTATKFKHSFEGKDKGDEPFEYEELGKLVEIYHDIQKKDYKGLFRSLANGETRVSSFDFFGI